MFDFFNEFFQSDLVKHNVVAFTMIAILLIVIGAGLMWLYMSKIYMKSLENRNNKLNEEIERIKSELDKLQNAHGTLKARHEALVSESMRLRFMDEQYVARNTDMSDGALNEFVNSEE